MGYRDSFLFVNAPYALVWYRTVICPQFFTSIIDFSSFSFYQDGSNCVDILTMARRHDRSALQKVCEHYIAYNFGEVEKSEAFQLLAKEEQDVLRKSKKTFEL